MLKFDSLPELSCAWPFDIYCSIAVSNCLKKLETVRDGSGSYTQKTFTRAPYLNRSHFDRLVYGLFLSLFFKMAVLGVPIPDVRKKI